MWRSRLCSTEEHPSALITLTVRFMKFRNFFSISVMMEKSPWGRCLLTVVTLIWGDRKARERVRERRSHAPERVRLLLTWLPWHRQPSSRAV